MDPWSPGTIYTGALCYSHAREVCSISKTIIGCLEPGDLCSHLAIGCPVLEDVSCSNTCNRLLNENIEYNCHHFSKSQKRLLSCFYSSVDISHHPGLQRDRSVMMRLGWSAVDVGHIISLAQVKRRDRKVIFCVLYFDPNHTKLCIITWQI